jgi:glycine/D-amino acid oxidase-like deaminating enzyme
LVGLFRFTQKESSVPTRKLTRRGILAGAAGLTASLFVRDSRATPKRHGFAIIGRGPMGAAAARHLSAAAEDVVVIGPEEPEDWSQQEGAFASHYDEGRQFELVGSEEMMVHLAAQSLPGFLEVEKATGISFYRDHPNLRIGPEDFSDDHYFNWDGMRNVSSAFGVEAIDLDAEALGKKFPQFRFPSGSRALLEPKGGIINPRRMVRAQLQAAEANGASIVNDEVVALNPRAGDIELLTRSGGSVFANQVLVATGAFTNAANFLKRRLALHLYGVTVVLVEAPGDSRPDFPTFTCRFGSEKNAQVCFAMPPIQYPDGRWYIKGATASSVNTPIASDAAITPWFQGKGLAEDPDLVASMLRQLLPGFEPGPARGLPCIVSYTSTASPYIDRIDERVGISVGGNAWGVMTSDAIGRLASDMMRGVPWSGKLGAERFRAKFV